MKFNNIKTKKGAFLMLLMISLLSFNSCDDDFGDINDSFEANLTEATIPGLFNGLIESVKKGETRYRVPVSWLYQWTQLAAMFTASGFRLDDKTTEAWEKYYRSLANYHDLENLIAAEENPENYVNIQAMARIIMAYQALSTTLLYGDIPYSEAGQGFLSAQAFRPVYDSQQSVMQAAITDLTWAMDNLSTSASQVPLGGFDTLLNDDVDLWKKFANSLRLRYAMAMRDKDAAFADPIISAALGQPLLAPAEFVSLNPATISGLSNDRRGFYRGNSYIRMGSTMWEAMSSTNDVDGSGIYDLRCSILFEPNENDEWVPYPQNPDNTTPSVTGNPHVNERLDDWNSNRSNFASINAYYTLDNSIPQFIITGSQISFLRAEIYNRGIAGVTANQAMAETFYNEGITASVNFWYNHAFNSIWDVNKPLAPAPTDVELNGMLNNPNVAYSDNATTALSQIYEQSWISLFHQPFEAWNLQRRTNNGTPNVPLAATSLVTDFNRLTYPPSERETNRVNWTAVTGGSDSETSKIWIQQ